MIELNECLLDTSVNFKLKELFISPQMPIVIKKKERKKKDHFVCFCNSLGFQKVAEKSTRTQQRDL